MQLPESDPTKEKINPLITGSTIDKVVLAQAVSKYLNPGCKYFEVDENAKKVRKPKKKQVEEEEQPLTEEEILEKKEWLNLPHPNTQACSQTWILEGFPLSLKEWEAMRNASK